MAKQKIINCAQQIDLITAYRDRNWRDSVAHKHLFWELILVEHGEGTHVINATSHHFRAGFITLLSPSDFHLIAHEPGGSSNTAKVKFNDAVWRDHLKDICRFDQFPVVATLCDEDFAKARKIIDLLCEENRSPERSADAAFSIQLLASILVLIKRNLSTGVKADPTKTNSMIQYIQDHFCEPISITNVANALNYSTKYFSRLFVKEMGIPFHQYIKELRLNYAHHLIKYSDLPVVDICYNTGFSSPSYFSKSFKQKYGVSPTQLRSNPDL